jgi:adenosylcobyric acid synthase
MGAVLMVQGTSSDSGKTILCAALCRYLAEVGYRVAPFKGQNMALNAMAVPGGGEIGWAQVMQAEAAGVVPEVAMNPVLLKPVSDTVCQVILQGRSVGDFSAREYLAYKDTAFSTVLASLDSLRHRFDVVVMEGAGSPAEVNLREHDIVNMRLAEAADAPVLLVSDIDRGGMFAYVAGTLALLTEAERNRVKGVVVNRFRGDKERLLPGLQSLEELTGKPVVGVIPHLAGLSLPPEDSFGLSQTWEKPWELDVAVIQFPRIANFTDLHVLGEEEGVRVRYVSDVTQLGEPHVIILPGTKNTIADLAWMKDKGLAQVVVTAAQNGTFVVGICGGYQMLGTEIRDFLGVDGAGGSVKGLNLLPVETDFHPEKTTVRTRGKTVKDGEEVRGYEIHMGRTRRLGGEPFARLYSEDGKCSEDGASSLTGRILGTYLHGLFDSTAFRQGYLNRVREVFLLQPCSNKAGLSAAQQREKSYALLGDAIREHLDTGLLVRLLEEQEDRR